MHRVCRTHQSSEWRNGLQICQLYHLHIYINLVPFLFSFIFIFFFNTRVLRLTVFILTTFCWQYLSFNSCTALTIIRSFVLLIFHSCKHRSSCSARVSPVYATLLTEVSTALSRSVHVLYWAVSNCVVWTLNRQARQSVDVSALYIGATTVGTGGDWSSQLLGWGNQQCIRPSTSRP